MVDPLQVAAVERLADERWPSLRRPGRTGRDLTPPARSASQCALQAAMRRPALVLDLRTRPPNSRPPALKVGMRDVDGGAVSTSAGAGVRPGDEVEACRPAAASPADTAGNSRLVVAGSGITPVLSIAPRVLAGTRRPRLPVQGDRRPDTRCSLDEVADLKDTYTDRLPAGDRAVPGGPRGGRPALGPAGPGTARRAAAGTAPVSRGRRLVARAGRTRWPGPVPRGCAAAGSRPTACTPGDLPRRGRWLSGPAREPVAAAATSAVTAAWTAGRGAGRTGGRMPVLDAALRHRSDRRSPARAGSAGPAGPS